MAHWIAHFIFCVVQPQSHALNSRQHLLLATALIGIVWQLPYGNMLLYPLTLLATYTHELGHGLHVVVLGEPRSQRRLPHRLGSGEHDAC